MKMKKFLMTAFAVTMLFGISACPNENANCSTEGTLSVDNSEKIFEVGSRIELDELVKISGLCGAKNYTIKLENGSEQILQVREHTLFVLDEGSFKVGIIAGPEGAKKKVNFVGTAYSPLKMKYYKLSSTLTNRFGFLGIEEDSNGNQIVTEQIFHNPNYYFECRTTNQGVKGIGYVKFPVSGKAYQFVCNDFEGNTFEWDGRDFQFDKRSIMQPWNVKIDNVTTEVDVRAQDYLLIPGDKPANNPNYFNNMAEEFAYNALGIRIDPATDYEVNAVHVYCETVEDVDSFYFDLLIKKPNTNPELYGRYKLLAGTEAQCSWIETKIRNQEEPPKVDTSGLEDKLVHLNNAANYTMTLNQWWEDLEGNEPDLSTHENARVRSVYSNVPRAIETTKVDAVNMKCLSTVAGVKFNGAIRGYALHDDVTYMIDNNNPDSDTSSVTPYVDLVGHRQENIDILDVMNKYSLRALRTGEGTIFEQFDALEKEETGTNTMIHFRGAGKNSEIIYNAIGMFQTLGYCYNRLFSSTINTNSYQFFDCTFMYSATAFQLVGHIQHDIVAPDNSRTDSFIYNFEITVSAVGTTDVDLTDVHFEEPVNALINY